MRFFIPPFGRDQASVGAQIDPTALLHPWKAAVTLRLSRSMRSVLAASVGRMDTALLLFGRRPLGVAGREVSLLLRGSGIGDAGATLPAGAASVRPVKRPSPATARDARSGRARSASTDDRRTLAPAGDCESADIVVGHDAGRRLRRSRLGWSARADARVPRACRVRWLRRTSPRRGCRWVSTRSYLTWSVICSTARTAAAVTVPAGVLAWRSPALCCARERRC